MVAEAVECGVVATEAFVVAVVVLMHGLACPGGVTFYAEVVVSLSGKVGVAAVALENTLGECDTCGYASTVHLLYGPVFVFGHVGLTVEALGGYGDGECGRHEEEDIAEDGHSLIMCERIWYSGIGPYCRLSAMMSRLLFRDM